MEILLTKQCASLTGALGRGFGYFIVSRKGRFYSQRSKREPIPPDGHWKLIAACAKLAKSRLYVSDVRVHWQELYDALYEAYHFQAARHVVWNECEAKKLTYNANDIINLQIAFGL